MSSWINSSAIKDSRETLNLIQISCIAWHEFHIHFDHKHMLHCVTFRFIEKMFSFMFQRADNSQVEAAELSIES